MMEERRLHPMKIIASILGLLKDSIFIILILFVLNTTDAAIWIKVLRVVFLVYLITRIGGFIIEWWKTTFAIKDGTIHIKGGLFKRQHNSIPLYEIQNITRNTPAYYRPFQLTSLKLETSAASDNATVKLEAMKTDQATEIEEIATDYKLEGDRYIEKVEDNHVDSPPNDSVFIQSADTNEYGRTVHFTSTKKDVIKASFLSFSFLALIPVLIIGYQKIDEIVDVEKQAEGLIAFLRSSWIITTIAIVAIILVAIAFGVVSTYLKYGKYEISSDDERIFIHSGVLTEKAFSIRKANVQAIQVSQGPLKKLLGMSEIKLISAGSMEGETDDISTLYPFLPTERASSLIVNLLPHLPMKQAMHKLPKNAFYMRMIRFPWLWLIVSVIILWWKITWWPIIIVLFVFTYAGRLFDYRNTRFAWDESGIHFKKGGLWTEHFITNRKKVIEVEVEQSLIQRKLGIASITTVNRVKPVHHEYLEDIPFSDSQRFIQWYGERSRDMETE